MQRRFISKAAYGMFFVELTDQLTVPATDFASMHFSTTQMHYLMLFIGRPIMFFLSPPPMLILLVHALKSIPFYYPCFIQP